MDVGAITKGRGKGKREGKHVAHGDGGKGKKGKKGKQAKNAEKSKDHDQFDGYCGSCGQWGHKHRHCWRNKKGPQVNMFLKMNRWHHVQHINRYNFQHSAHLLRGY